MFTHIYQSLLTVPKQQLEDVSCQDQSLGKQVVSYLCLLSLLVTRTKNSLSGKSTIWKQLGFLSHYVEQGCSTALLDAHWSLYKKKQTSVLLREFYFRANLLIYCHDLSSRVQVLCQRYFPVIYIFSPQHQFFNIHPQ